MEAVGDRGAAVPTPSVDGKTTSQAAHCKNRKRTSQGIGSNVGGQSRRWIETSIARG